MTDLTELAQSLKRRATSANEFGESLYVKADDILTLVEALEKAQQRIKMHERAEYTWMNALALPDGATREDILSGIQSANFSIAWLRGALEQMIQAHKTTLRTGYERIIDLGGDCDSPEVMIAGNPDILSAEKVIAAVSQGESRTVTAENLQESAYRAGLTAGWNLGLANNNDGFNKCLAAHTAAIKVEAE